MANLYVLPRVRYKVGLLRLDEKPSPLNVYAEEPLCVTLKIDSTGLLNSI